MSGNFSYRFYNYLWRLPWLKPAFGKSLYKKICRYGDAPDVPFEKEFYGLKYQGNLRNNIEFNIYYFGAFEKPLLFFLRDAVEALHRDETTFCDIGANIGQHALFMSMVADRVHAFEPWQPVRERLLHHIQINYLNNVSVHPVGLGDESVSLPFYAPTGRNQGIGSFDSASQSKGNSNVGELALVIGDDYLEDNSITQVDLIKVDVEGFEKAVLTGLRRTLEKNRPIVVCEITYGGELAFTSLEELKQMFPREYVLMTFDTRKANGSKSRRRGSAAKRSGFYQLIPYNFDFPKGQDDIVACPCELMDILPMHYDGGH